MKKQLVLEDGEIDEYNRLKDFEKNFLQDVKNNKIPYVYKTIHFDDEDWRSF